MSQNLLEIKNLHVKVEEKEILKGLNLSIPYNETHAIMGPNGAGKSVLSNVLSNYQIPHKIFYLDYLSKTHLEIGFAANLFEKNIFSINF